MVPNSPWHFHFKFRTMAPGFIEGHAIVRLFPAREDTDAIGRSRSAKRCKVITNWFKNVANNFTMHSVYYSRRILKSAANRNKIVRVEFREKGCASEVISELLSKFLGCHKHEQFVFTRQGAHGFHRGRHVHLFVFSDYLRALNSAAKIGTPHSMSCHTPPQNYPWWLSSFRLESQN